MYFDRIKIYMRLPEEIEHNYIIFAYSDPMGNDAIRLLLWKKPQA